MRLIKALYEALTGTPWTTGRQLSTDPALAHLGPPPAIRYPELAQYSDAELIRRDRHEVIAEILQARAEQAARQAAVERLLADLDAQEATR